MFQRLLELDAHRYEVRTRKADPCLSMAGDAKWDPMLQIQWHQASSSPSGLDRGQLPRGPAQCASVLAVRVVLWPWGLAALICISLKVSSRHGLYRDPSIVLHHQSRASTPCIGIHVVLPRISSYFGYACRPAEGLAP